MDTKVSNTSETTQHPTPPASSASSTPSPSNASLHPHAARAIQATSAGYRTPPPQIARNSGTRVSVFHDTQIFPRSNSQSSLFSAASEAGTETPKRRATEAPLSRPRSQTFQARPQSMCGSSNSQSFLPQSSHYSLGVNGSSTPRNYLGSHQQDQAQEFSLPQPSDAMDCKSLESDSSSPPSNESNDPIESGSNKRPKIQPRALRGRGDRATSWHGKPPPTLRSDSSMIADLNLTSVNDDDDFPKTPVARTPAPFIVWQDNEEKTPVKKSGLRRAPLTDISLSIGTSTMPAVIFDAKPLAPLMTRKPKKAITRSRLVVVSSFPNSQHYWDEYANDTFKYLLEIESRYDRYMYFDPEFEFGDHRSTLVQWIIELCYGCFFLPTGTLHAAVNILDRYLAVVKPETVHRDKLQCVGMCALMIAGKLEEPAGTLGAFNLCQLCDLYSTRELANTEIDILKALKFEILVASATGFSDYIKRAIADNDDTWQLIDFLCDLSLISHRFLEFSPCQIAATAVWISLCASGQDWDENLAILTGFARQDMTPCSVVFHELICPPNQPLDLQLTLGHRYPINETMATLRKVLNL